MEKKKLYSGRINIFGAVGLIFTIKGLGAVTLEEKIVLYGGIVSCGLALLYMYLQRKEDIKERMIGASKNF